MTDQKLHAVMLSGDSDRGRTFAAARRSSGHSLIEMLIVVALIGVLISLALPQLIAERRMSRTVAVNRDILTQLRHARQLAMSQRQAITFQYDNVSRLISIIDHNSNPGPVLLIDPSYPNTFGSRVVSATPLTAGTAVTPEISYGIPAGVPIAPLGDGITMTPLVNNQLNITFQPDGSVIDAAGNPIGRALFIYNNKAPKATASAISIMGASGRVKIWRYDSGTNLYAGS
jgi:prepilin-type N-terminal cleavage/methylation domain-containing protein